MKQLNATEFLAQFDESIHSALLNAIQRYPDSIGLVCFENANFDSSRFGERSALVVGPSNTYRTFADCENQWINDLPSERQYATNYATRDTLEKELSDCLEAHEIPLDWECTVCGDNDCPGCEQHPSQNLSCFI
jgi:hypothetical protein